MPPRVARAKIGRSPKKIKAVGKLVDAEDEDFPGYDEDGPSVSYWFRFKLWIAEHEHKWGAIFYAIFLLIFTLVVLKSQVMRTLVCLPYKNYSQLNAQHCSCGCS